MKKLYIMCGVAFSGKSTLAKQIADYKHATLISQDEFWFEKEKEWNLNIDNDGDWERVEEISRAEIKKALMSGASVVYDDISLENVERELLRTLAKECGAEAVLVYLDTPRTVQQERQAKNLETKERHDVKPHIIEMGLAMLEVPQESEHPFVFTPDTDVADWLSTLL